MNKVFFVFGVLMSLQAFASTQGSLPPVNTVAFVDLHQYLGRWYEIAAIPQSFEKQCVGNTMAEYADAGGAQVSVTNTCETSQGRWSVAHGRAKVVDTKTYAKLKVTFVDFLGWQFLLGGDYWILGLGENYNYAVVGAPGRDYAWILSRTADMSEEQLSEATQVLEKQGFDTCKLISTPQGAGLHESAELCHIVIKK